MILFQHYGWDAFSEEFWDPARHTFDDADAGPAHWWTAAERDALVATLAPYNVIAIFHGHEHEQALVYRQGKLDLFKPKAGFMGGFAVARVTDAFLDVVLAEVTERRRRHRLHPRLLQASAAATRVTRLRPLLPDPGAARPRKRPLPRGRGGLDAPEAGSGSGAVAAARRPG